MLRNLKKIYITRKTKSSKKAVLNRGGSLTALRRLLLHGGAVCLANLGGLCLHGGGS